MSSGSMIMALPVYFETSPFLQITKDWPKVHGGLPSSSEFWEASALTSSSSASLTSSSCFDSPHRHHQGLESVPQSSHPEDFVGEPGSTTASSGAALASAISAWHVSSSSTSSPLADLAEACSSSSSCPSDNPKSESAALMPPALAAVNDLSLLPVKIRSSICRSESPNSASLALIAPSEVVVIALHLWLVRCPNNSTMSSP
mmetsp:Transcript_147265/g.282242  ORF Transcript_147265/g.282242 Transcript_147265/m.282242 type:complete len:202 (+) Transcript_147265:91-696(+)